MELPPALPGLDCVAIDRLSMGWSDGGLWHDIEWLAGRFWSADGRNRTIAWHHLVLAVGNFKRQPGRRLRPALDAQLDYNPPPAPANFDVPGTDPIVNVVVGDPETWDALSEALPGSGVATTTTLLSALWPEAHFVFDWRVHAAATALRIKAGLDPGGTEPDSSTTRPLDFDDYRCVRMWLLDTAAVEGRRVAHVERALYCLSRKVARSEGRRTWRSYADDVAEELARERTS